MIYLNETFGSFYGSGYLVLDYRPSPAAAYKLVLCRDTFSGGGVILGLAEQDAVKAAKLKNVRLRVAPDKFFELVIGHYDGGDQLAAAVTKLTIADPTTLQ